MVKHSQVFQLNFCQRYGCYGNE